MNASIRPSLAATHAGVLRAVFCAAVAVGGWGAAGEAAEASYAIAMHGEPAMPDGFRVMPYANPDAPKGGRLVQGVLGTFDSLNPLIVKGLAVPPIRGYVIESLMARGYDEPFTLYGLLARTVETDDARSYVTFTLDPAARFSDGKPVTAEDVVFSWQLLRDKGRPNHRTYYSKVTKAAIVGERGVRFDFADGDDRELPLILGLMPVLPKHAIDAATFEETSFDKPVGSGPYVVSTVDPGKSVTLKRDPNYWGRELAVNRGLWNFDEVRFDYYRDGNTHFEAFKKGLYDVRTETDPGRWQTGYDFPAVRDGRVVKGSISERPAESHRRPGVQHAAADFRRHPRARGDPAAVRLRMDQPQLFLRPLQAHRQLFRRLRSLRLSWRPADARERALLAPFPDAVRPDVLDGTWSPPVTDGSGRDRTTLRQALALFAEAGYEPQGTALRDRGTGRPFAFEILVTTRDEERLALAFSSNLKRAGIDAKVRVVDAVQYDRRKLTFDFDMIQNRWEQSLSPGNEQSFYWGSAAADQDGTRNYMGVKSPAIDAMIAAMLRRASARISSPRCARSTAC